MNGQLSRDVEGPWYRALDRRQWNTLIASNLGWLFDGFENYALILTVAPALGQLLPKTELAQLPFYIGAVIAINLLGWAVGGLLGGVLADYFGRKRMMVWAIIAYSLATGLSAFAFSWWSFAALRFLVGVTVGSEWATGSSMMAELWPDRARGRGAGLMQCGLGIGFFLASIVWLFVAQLGDDAWRYMYLLGVLPALVTLWIRREIPESVIWEETAVRREQAKARTASGARLTPEERQLVKFTLVDLFTDPAARGLTILALLMSLATTVGFWSISTWVPQFIGAAAAGDGLQASRWASYAGMAYTVGSIAGYVAFGFLADALGRRPVTFAFFLVAMLLTPVLFFVTDDLGWLLALAFLNAIFSNGQYTWMPVWLPELFPTRMRGTALAVIFNLPRFLAFAGPLLAGSLIVAFGGFGWAAVALSSVYVLGLVGTPFLPETHGRRLPH